MSGGGRVSARVSVIIPARDRVGLTARCLEAVRETTARVDLEVIVVDDGSQSPLGDRLQGMYPELTIIRHETAKGFAAACNAGAEVARGYHLCFLNNDTVPSEGWLDALVVELESDPAVAVAGSRLLFPNGTVQHAGIVFGQDGFPHHLYAGFAGDHPAVARSRDLQAVTGACMLVRHGVFDEVAGFDTRYRNGFEDVDLCLRLARRGHRVRYCAQSVVTHLESVTRGRRSRDIRAGADRYRDQWRDEVRRDDLDVYAADGLLNLQYAESHPARLVVDPQLAVTAHQGDSQALLAQQARLMLDLTREVARLTAHLAELEGAERPGPATGVESTPASLRGALDHVLAELLELQQAIESKSTSFEASGLLAYRAEVSAVRRLIEDVVPRGEAVAVVSRGDDELTSVSERNVLHFPCDADGAYTGSYPADDFAAVRDLEHLISLGVSHLVLPRTAFWWLEHYPGLDSHLRETWELTCDTQSAMIFSSPQRDRLRTLAAPAGVGERW